MTNYQTLEAIENKVITGIEKFKQENISIEARVEDYEDSYDTVLLVYNEDVLLMDQVYTTSLTSFRRAMEDTKELCQSIVACLEENGLDDVSMNEVVAIVDMPN